jgi:hypothetical protein
VQPDPLTLATLHSQDPWIVRHAVSEFMFGVKRTPEHRAFLRHVLVPLLLASRPSSSLLYSVLLLAREFRLELEHYIEHCVETFGVRLVFPLDSVRAQCLDKVSDVVQLLTSRPATQPMTLPATLWCAGLLLLAVRALFEYPANFSYCFYDLTQVSEHDALPPTIKYFT